VQAPFIDGKAIEASCSQLVRDFAEGRKSLFSSMLGDLVRESPAQALLRENLVRLPETTKPFGKDVTLA
jgi:hypothetical protein